eukprot:5568867-Pyramimonas_sp.AAC.1
MAGALRASLRTPLFPGERPRHPTSCVFTTCPPEVWTPSPVPAFRAGPVFDAESWQEPAVLISSQRE